MSAARRSGTLSILRLLLWVGIVSLVASPLLPHDAACHVKARTDCAACTLDLASGDVRAHTPPGAARLDALAGQLLPPDSRLPARLLVASHADRAPPA